MTTDKLNSYALLGHEFMSRQEMRKEAMKRALKDVSEEDYQQLLEMARVFGDKDMQTLLPVLWEQVKNDKTRTIRSNGI